MIRRLITAAAGVAIALTVALPLAAPAGATAVHKKTTCTTEGGDFFNVTKSGVNYYLGTPNTTFAGATVRLKPKKNSTTFWIGCFFPTSNTVVLTNRGLALTSRSFSPGANVTVTPAGNGGDGFTSQRWDFVEITSTSVTFQNEKTHLYLRVRNSGPTMGQTVTTGATPTAWIFST